MRRWVLAKLEPAAEVEEAPASEYHGFLAKARVASEVLVITIPAEVAKSLGLRPGDLLEVALRKAGRSDLARYGGLPKGPRAPLYVRCPKCGEVGRLGPGPKGCICVVHGGRRRCYACGQVGRDLAELLSRHRLLASEAAASKAGEGNP